MPTNGLNRVEFCISSSQGLWFEGPWWWGDVGGRNLFKMQKSNSFVKQKNEFLWLSCLKMCELNSWISLWWRTLLLTCCLFFPSGTSVWTTSVSCPWVLSTVFASWRSCKYHQNCGASSQRWTCLSIFVSHIFSGNQIKQSKQAVSTTDFGPWGNT